MLLFEGLINWDLLAVGLRGRRAVGAGARPPGARPGVLIGLGTAIKLYPLFLLGALCVICGPRARWRDLAVATR